MLAGSEPWAEQCWASSEPTYGATLLHVEVPASLGIWDGRTGHLALYLHQAGKTNLNDP